MGRMTVLSRSAVNHDMLTVQCDVCVLPLSATTREQVFVDSGWQLRERGFGLDICPNCRRAWGRPVPRLEAVRELDPTAGRLPNLLLIGAAKCGTTSLHHYLDAHPAISMARLKELRFFQDPEYHDRLGWYRAQFETDALIAGESSTMYTRAPAMPGTAARAATLVPDARLIFMVRDPIDRAVASYLEERFQGLDPRPVEEAFADVEDPYNPYVSASRYAEQLAPYLEHFGSDQLLVLALRDLEADADATLARVFTFLDVDGTDWIDTSARHNVGDTKYEYGPLATRLRRSLPGKILSALPPGTRTALQSGARRVLSRPLKRPTLSPALRARVADALAPDVEKFRRLTGREFADWSL